MSTATIANIVIVVGAILAMAIMGAVHVRQRLQGRKPGQRWDKIKGQWVDW